VIPTIWSTDGITQDNQNIQRKTCLSVTLSTASPTWNGLEPNSGLCPNTTTTEQSILKDKRAINRVFKQTIVLQAQQYMKHIASIYKLETVSYLYIQITMHKGPVINTYTTLGPQEWKT